MQEDVCAKLMKQIFAGPVRDKILGTLVKRSRKKIEKNARKGLLTTFGAMRSAVSKSRHEIGALAVPLGTNAACKRLAKTACRYMARHPSCMTSTNEVIAATWLTLFSCGISHKGLIAVPKDKFVSQHMPAPSLMSMVPKVHCRSISTAVRQFRSHLFSDNGTLRPGRSV